jgi:hypothetical protein
MKNKELKKVIKELVLDIIFVLFLIMLSFYVSKKIYGNVNKINNNLGEDNVINNDLNK